MPASLERLFFNASDLKLGQPEQVALLNMWLELWKNSRVEIVAITDGDQDALSGELQKAGLRQFFEDVVSLSGKQKYVSYGALLHNGLRKDGWVPREQIMMGSSAEIMKTIWLDESGQPRRCALAHTLRVPAGAAFSEDQFKALNDRIFMPHPKTTTHAYMYKHDQATAVDFWDTPDKCLLDVLSEQDRKAALGKKGGGDALKPFVKGRADLAKLAGVPAYNPEPGEEEAPPAAAKSDIPPKVAVWGTPPEKAPAAPARPSAAPGQAAERKAPPKRTVTIYDIQEGMEIVIGEGPDAGEVGVIAKVTGEGKDKRFRVNLSGGKSTWTTKVRGVGMEQNIGVADVPVGRPNVVSPLMAALNGGSPQGGKGGGKAAPPAGSKPKESAEKEEFPEGVNVEVLAGPNKGKCGTVLKISGEGKEKKWRVQLEAGGPSAWVAAVGKCTRALEKEVQVVKIEDLYEIDKKKLGTGAFGSVSKAKNKATGLIRAAKNIRKPMVKNLDVIWKEVAFMRRLDHPNIIRVYDTFEDARSVYLIMELATGGELFDRIVNDGAMMEVQAATVMQHILRGLFYIHTKKICHRDLKPENFLLTSREPLDKTGLKIIDFGIAHDFPEPGETLRSRVGSSYYVAPEVLQSRYNELADMWSYGVITFLVLSGSPPFAGETDDEIEKKVQKGVYDFNDPVWTQVSPDAKDFIQKLMVMDWEKGRYSAQQAMAHTWINLKAPKSKPVKLDGALKNLKVFQSASTMKKIALQVIATQCSDEQVSHLRETFQALDDNGDGFLTTEEVRKGIEKVGLSNVPELEAMMNQIDYNKSGRIDYTEFLGAALDAQTYQKEDLCWGAFRVFDKNGDGKISKDELAEVLKDADVQQMMSGDIDKMLKEIDTNADGEVDFKEFMAMMKAN